MQLIRIDMEATAPRSNNPKDISTFYVKHDSGQVLEYTKEELYDYLLDQSTTPVFVGNSTAHLIPVLAMNGEKYIRSIPNTDTLDKIMTLRSN